MKLCEIIGKAKPGDRIRGDWMGEGEHYFVQDGLLMFSQYEDVRVAKNYTTTVLTANYEFLPPEPKFKVGDEVSCMGQVKLLGAIDKTLFKINEWQYRVPEHGWFWENQITLCTGPDICKSCGQEVGEKDKLQKYKFSVGDKVIVCTDYWAGETKRGTILTIKSIDSDSEYYRVEEGYCGFRPEQLKLCTEPPIEWDGGDLPKWKAFFLTWKHWQDVVDNRLNSKEEWKKLSVNGGAVARPDKLCFACEYQYCRSSITREFDYSKCIMAELWPEGCESKGSPYESWRWNKGDRKSAQTIADFAKKKYCEEIASK